jgi:hypothetical protein
MVLNEGFGSAFGTQAAPTSTLSAFGQQPATNFSFGSNQPTTAQTFGQPAAAQTFGQPAATTSTGTGFNFSGFGAPQQQQQQQPGQQQQQTSLFGNTGSAFGALGQNKSLFGTTQPNVPGFGGTVGMGFGAPQQTTGGIGSAFGAKPATSFAFPQGSFSTFQSIR